MKKISIFLICSLLMIFGLSFSACANAVTTGGVTATAVAPRAVDSSGNIIDVSENINHVEHTAFAKKTPQRQKPPPLSLHIIKKK